LSDLKRACETVPEHFSQPHVVHKITLNTYKIMKIMHTGKATYTIFNEISSNILSTGEGQQEWK